MKPKLNLLNLIPWISVLVFALLSWYFLFMRNADVLYMQQLRSLFNDTSEFWQQYQTQPAGFLQWVGCYFTQLFYYPALGSSVLILMWIAIFFTMKKALRISNALSPILLIPLVCLLISEIDLGYWIYYNKNDGYCFSQTIGLLSASLLVLAFRSMASVKFKYGTTIVAILGSIIIALCYRYLGIYAMAASFTLGVIMLLGRERKWIAGAVYIIAALATPRLFQQVFDTMRSDRFFKAGLPVFESGKIISTSLTTPFEIALLTLILFPILYKVGERIKSPKVATIIPSLLLVAVIGFSFGALEDADYDDENYHAECKAYRAIDEMKWEDALHEIRQINGTLTRQLIMFKNIALFNTGDIGNTMYDYDDKGMRPTPSDSLKVHMANTAAPIIYLHHGMTNFAYRWCMENQVEIGFNIAELKVMVLSSIINGESKLTEKYLNILSHTIYYKEWAERFQPLAHNPKLISKYPELTKIHDLHSHIGNQSDSDAGLCENFILHYFSRTQNKDSKYFQELTLAYAMMAKDIQLFWPRYLLYLYLHKGEKIPVLYQQAAFLYGNLEPHSAPNPAQYGMQFDKTEIIDRYNQFQRLTQGLMKNGFSNEAIARQTEAEFGNTFWWVYFFNRDSKYY